MYNSNELRITEGQVKVGEVENLLDEQYCKVWHVELLTKSVAVAAYVNAVVFLRDTTMAGDLPAATGIWTNLGEEWEVVCDVARYNLSIVAYRLPTFTGSTAD